MHAAFTAGRRRSRGVGRLALTAVVSLAASGCAAADGRDLARSPAGRDSLDRMQQDSINRSQPGYVVDSIFPVEEELGRFRAAIGGRPVTTLAGGSPSRDSLVRRVVAALTPLDTGALAAVTLDVREFADLVYPESPYTSAPYRQPPGLVWAQIRNSSRTGFRRLTARAGGLGLRLVAHDCAPNPERQGRNRIWTRCTVTLASASGLIETHRLFGSILERDGQFKIVSWTGEF